MPGFSVKLKEEGVDPKYCCSSCGLLLNEPRQTSCGHRYCRTCLDDLNRGQHEEVLCKASSCTQHIKIEETFPDRAIEKEIRNFEVVCDNSDDGCLWQGRLHQLNGHHDECDFEKIACIHKDCGQKVPRKALSAHLTDDCELRVAACKWCNGSQLYKDLVQHQESCTQAPAKCTWCGKKGMTRAQMQEHQHPQTGDCHNMKQLCIFEPLGCQEKLERKQHGDHQKQSTTAHLNMVLGKILKPEASNLETLREQMFSSYQSEGATGSGSGASKALENRTEQLRAKLEDVVRKLAAWEPRVGTFEGIVAVLNREIEKCSSQIEAYERQRRQDREIIETLERKIRYLERIIALNKVALAEQDLRIQTLELTSYDGILTWKIPDFTRKRHDAITGKTTSFYSPCFFTSRPGYKMCARIYLNGDGMGKGTHVSLFFVVMRGHSDIMMRWPFRQKVIFMLLDQNNREHVIDAFRPDPTSSSFQRPTSDMNIASGCPLFVPLSQVMSSSHAYVREDTMLIRVIVDTSE